MAKYYGCGLTIPTELGGLKVLDLGSGSGRDEKDGRRKRRRRRRTSSNLRVLN